MDAKDKNGEIKIGKYGFSKSREGVWISHHYFDKSYTPDIQLLTEPSVTLLEALNAKDAIIQERDAEIEKTAKSYDEMGYQAEQEIKNLKSELEEVKQERDKYHKGWQTAAKDAFNQVKEIEALKKENERLTQGYDPNKLTVIPSLGDEYQRGFREGFDNGRLHDEECAVLNAPKDTKIKALEDELRIARASKNLALEKVTDLEKEVDGLEVRFAKERDSSLTTYSKFKKLSSALNDCLGALKALRDRVKYMIQPSKTESPSEVCQECGCYGYGEVVDCLIHVDELLKRHNHLRKG